MVGENYVGGYPLPHDCITLEQLRRYMTPSRAARVIFENSQIYSIFGTAPLAPMGASRRWLKTKLAPSSMHDV